MIRHRPQFFMTILYDEFHVRQQCTICPYPGQIEITWQQVMIGVQSSIIMFPVNLLIVSIFRNTRPRQKKVLQVNSQAKADSNKQGKTGRVSPTQPPSPGNIHKEITPNSVVKVTFFI